MPSLPRPQIAFRILLFVVFAAAAFAYANYRQRGIGACDWYGYYELGQLFRQGQVNLPTALPAADFPALVPLGFSVHKGQVVPQYAPGYPLLLAVAGWLHAEFFVSPLLGLLSIWLIYLLARDLTDRWTGLATAAAWAFLPLVVFGSTRVMSDLAATVPLLGSYLLYRRKHLAASALLLGFSLSVRPTNVLYCLAFALPLLRDRQVVRFVLWMLPTAGAYAFYNHMIYGAPWRTGYGSVASELTSSVFGGHLAYFLVETAKHLGPFALFAAFARHVRDRTEVVFYLLWFLAYLIFYSFWLSGGSYWPLNGAATADSVWWWTRFILPAYPPLFLLASLGLHRLRAWATDEVPAGNPRRWARAALLTLVVGTPLYHLQIGSKLGDIWLRGSGLEYVRAVRAVEEITPPDSCVGSVEFAGAFRVYSDRLPFVSTYESAPALVAELFRRGRGVYLVVEPWNANNTNVQLMLSRYQGSVVRVIPVWGAIAVTVYHLTPPVAP